MEDNRNNNENEELPEFPERIINEGYIPDEKKDQNQKDSNIGKDKNSNK